MKRHNILKVMMDEEFRDKVILKCNDLPYSEHRKWYAVQGHVSLASHNVKAVTSRYCVMDEGVGFSLRTY